MYACSFFACLECNTSILTPLFLPVFHQSERHEERFSEVQEDDEDNAPASAAERAEAANLQRQSLLANLTLNTGTASAGPSVEAAHPLRRTLILRINDADDELALATLHLFDALLQSRDPEACFFSFFVAGRSIVALVDSNFFSIRFTTICYFARCSRAASRPTRALATRCKHSARSHTFE